VSWVETSSPHFAARHSESDSDDVAGVLDLLEHTRERLAGGFPTVPDEVAVVVHPSRPALYAAKPALPFISRLTAPAARRYVVGWFSRDAIHLLAPRFLRARASNVPGSREMAMLAPAALYAQLVAGHNNPRLPPPFRPWTLARWRRWAWLSWGAGQYFSGQTGYVRPAITRRLREGPRPRFPPTMRDAPLLGGTVLDLLAREEGDAAAVRLACEPVRGDPRKALIAAFQGRSLVHTEGTWRTHLARLAGQ
jgi:hypothetical protein